MISLPLIRSNLIAPVELDNYLVDIASRIPTHGFLRGATQGCYVRMVQLLVAIYVQQGRNPATVRVLDWGAGKGHISYLLKAAGFDVTSCDIRSFAEDSSFGQYTPIVEDNALKIVPLSDPWILPFNDREFDLVVSFGVLEHVPNDLESLKEIHRILVPGGVFFFTFLPYWLSWSQWLARLRGDWYHPRLYKVRILKQMASDSRFYVEGIWHGQLFPKNSFPHNNSVERIDRLLTSYTPLKYLATNIEGILIAK